MMKGRIILALAMVMSLFTSCEKDEDLKEIVLKESGSFLATITNSESQPYSNKSVFLYQDGELISEVITDENGVADFQHVNRGNYQLLGNNFEEGELKYSFERTVQIVAGEERIIEVTPSDYCGDLTVELYEKHMVGINEYSDLVEQNGGNIVLYDIDRVNSSGFEFIRDAAIYERKLSDDSNTITFEKLPIGRYGLMYYTDENHYQVLNSTRYVSEGSEYYNLAYVRKGENNKVKHVINGALFNDYTGKVSITAFEYYQFSYSSRSNASELKTGKVALISGDRYSNMTFEQMQQLIVAEEELDGSINKVEFNDVKVGRYRVVIYSDEEHFQVAQLGFANSSSNYIQVSEDQVVEDIALVNATKIREIKINQDFFVYERNYSSGYSNREIEGAKVYILEQSVYSNLEYSFRRSENIIKMFAENSGVTGEDGKLKLSVDAYTQLAVVVFKKDGSFIASRDFYSFGSEVQEFRAN